MKTFLKAITLLYSLITSHGGWKSKRYGGRRAGVSQEDETHICTVELPESMCFVSKEWYSLMADMTSSPHDPDSNWLAEMAVQTVKNLWGRGGNIHNALLACRATLLESGSRPDELMIGRRLRTNLPLHHTVAAETREFQGRDSQLTVRQRTNSDLGKRVRKLPVQEEKDSGKVEISHEDIEKLDAVRYGAESPDSYRVVTGSTFVRQNRKHLRKWPSRDPRG